MKRSHFKRSTPIRTKPKRNKVNAPTRADGVTGAQYMGMVAQLACAACQSRVNVQVHHCFHDRYSSHRTSDYDTIPLCEGCHQGDFDTTKLAIHRAKTQWRMKYGPDHSFIPQTRKAVQEIINRMAA